MDETTLEPTRESVLEEIKKCRQKIGTLLMIYFMVVLLQVVSGAGSLLLLFLETAGGMSILGRVLFAALPLLMWFYSQRPSSTGGVLMFYAVVEGIQAAILLAVVSAGSFFSGSTARPALRCCRLWGCLFLELSVACWCCLSNFSGRPAG